MHVLVTGKLSAITRETLKDLSGNHTIVCASEDIVEKQFGRGFKTFATSPRDADFEKLMLSYQFDVLIFFAQPLYTGGALFGEFEALEQCLQLCGKHDINRVLYLCPGIQAAREKSEQTVVYDACKRLCEFYNAQKGLRVIVADTPSLYSAMENASVLGNALDQAEKKASVHFRGASNQRCGFLADSDLSLLLLRICENWPAEISGFVIPAGEVLTLGQLGELLKKQQPTLRLSYGPWEPTEPAAGDDTLKKLYDWQPTRTLSDQLPQLIRKRQQNRDKAPRRSLADRFFGLGNKYPVIIRTLELILGFVIMEFLLRITGTTAQFRYIDFRLLYVVLMGTLYGIRSGLAAALLACASLLVASISEHSAWYAVAYDIDAWLPFLFIFLAGAVVGYTRDRLVSDNRNLSQEKLLLEEKYTLLNSFYNSSLTSKNVFKSQIASYQDSFGRLFEVSKNLDSVVADEVYAEAIHALEGMLDNRSVCIYSVDGGSGYGRLIACSREMRDIVGKSLRLDDYPELTGFLRDEQVWVNRDRLNNYPEYAYPFYSGDNLIALILVHKARYEQMAVYYENLVKIVCGLIKIALLRALEFTRRAEAEMYLPGTVVMNQEHFAKLMQAREKMAKSGMAEFSMIRLDISKDGFEENTAQISSLIRSTDALGIGKDGNLYLCLSQTNRENAQLVLMRIQNRGIPVRAYYMEG